MKPPIQLLNAITPVRNPLAQSPLRGRFLLLLLSLSCVLLPHAGAVPLTINFYQSGFTGGGSISGTLVGEDLNNDQVIDANEFAPFYSLDVVSFSGNSLLPAFTWHGFYQGPYLDLVTMRLEIWSEDLGAGPPPPNIGIWDYYSFYPSGNPIQGEIEFFDFHQQFVVLTTANDTVVSVPDAGSTGAMFALGLGGLIAARWRHSMKSLITFRLSRRAEKEREESQTKYLRTT